MDNAYAIAVIARHRQQELARAAQEYRPRRQPATSRRRRGPFHTRSTS